MRYLAVLVYNCGHMHEAGYAFMKDIRFSAGSVGELEKRVGKLKGRISKREDGFQAYRTGPIEIIVFDEKFKKCLHWDSRKIK